jgi:hypothetical protein
MIINFFRDYIRLNYFLNYLRKKIGNKNIAIVGSSRNLIGSKLGKKIDKFKLVCRFNLAPTKNFERDVGKKEDILVMNHLFFVGKRFNKFHQNTKKIKRKIIIVIVDHPDKNHIFFLKKNKDKFVHTSNKVIFFNNNLNHILRYRIVSQFNLIRKFNYYFKVKKFTGGLILISLMILLKNKFDIFGFDLFKKNNYVNYYYKKTSTKKLLLGTAHDFEKENLIIKKILYEFKKK